MEKKDQDMHVQAAYEHAMVVKIRKLQEENRILKQSLTKSEAHMAALWEEIMKLQDVIQKLSEEM